MIILIQTQWDGTWHPSTIAVRHLLYAISFSSMDSYNSFLYPNFGIPYVMLEGAPKIKHTLCEESSFCDCFEATPASFSWEHKEDTQYFLKGNDSILKGKDGMVK